MGNSCNINIPSLRQRATAAKSNETLIKNAEGSPKTSEAQLENHTQGTALKFPTVAKVKRNWIWTWPKQMRGRRRTCTLFKKKHDCVKTCMADLQNAHKLATANAHTCASRATSIQSLFENAQIAQNSNNQRSKMRDLHKKTLASGNCQSSVSKNECNYFQPPKQFIEFALEWCGKVAPHYFVTCRDLYR